MPDPAAVQRPWLDGYPPGVPPTYRYPTVPLTRFLDDAARDFPETTAVEAGATVWTYTALREVADGIAGGLLAAGLTAGERVGVSLANGPAAVALPFAVWRIGAVLVPIEPWLPSVEIVRVLEDADAAALVADRDVISRLWDDGVSRTTRITVSVDPATWEPPRRRFRRRRQPAPNTPRGVADLREVIADGAQRVAQHSTDADDLAVIAYTGGTLADRRGVMLTHANLVANAFQARLWVPDIQAGRERVLAANPFSHVYGLTMGLLATVLSAGTLIVEADPTPDRLVHAIAESRPTLFPAGSKLLEGIVEHPKVKKFDLTSLRACVSGGAPLPVEVAQRLRTLTGGCRVREGYGLTEASPLTHANPIYGRTHDGCIGLPVTDTVAIVVDTATGTSVLGPGEVGELAVAGPQVMAGYWRDPAGSADVRRGPWLLTGDLVVHDEAGFFTFVERKDDVVTVDGTMVIPRDVEAVLEGHRAVRAAAVVGVHDGEGVHLDAYVVLRRHHRRTSEDDLREHCVEHLEAASVPRNVHLVEELPTTRMGEVVRRHLREAS